jgi:hypothetical protein
LSGRKGEGNGAGAPVHEGTMVSDQELEFRYDHAVLGFLLAAIFSCAILFSHYVGYESVFMLVVFNFIFVSLVFSLNGSLAKKVLLLSTGNIVGVLWASLFSTFVYVLTRFGAVFNVLYLILGPFVNLVWIVTFFSLSLTVLATDKRGSNT